jgi:hypothetical protein
VADKKFDLGDYVEVKDRLKILYELYPQARLVTAEVRWPAPDDDKPRVAVKALAYRTPDDPQPAVGWSWMELPGTTSYTRGSASWRTPRRSAWGRAIAALGILVDRSIASAQEVANKQADEPLTPPAADRNPDGSLIGTAELGSGASDFELRQGPKGGVISFRLRSGRQTFKVIAEGPLADELRVSREDILGKLVTCWGRVSTDSWTPANARSPSNTKSSPSSGSRRATSSCPPRTVPHRRCQRSMTASSTAAMARVP